MKNYQYKHSKYKNRYLSLLNNFNNHLQPVIPNPNIQLDKIIIYPKSSMITKITNSNEQLLPGFIEDSIFFTDDNGIVKQSSFTSGIGLVSDEISTHKEISITLDDDTVITGIVVSIDSKMITISKDSQLVFIKKWKNAVMMSNKNSAPLFTTKSNGKLQYMIDTVNWTPIYNLFLDSNNTDETSATFYFMAYINNLSGFNIDAESIILVAGDTSNNSIGSDMNIQRMTSSRTQSKIQTQSKIKTQENFFSELIMFDLKKQTIPNEKIFLPIKIHKLKTITKTYSIDIGNNYQSQKQFISSDYGYKILVKDTEFPAGLFRIFTKIEPDNSNLLLGSIFIDRTPQNIPIEVVLGKTSRIRAEITKESKNLVVTDKQQITKNKVTGVITNDTNNIQDVIVKEYIGDASIIYFDKKPLKNMGYIKWIFRVDPGNTEFILNYQIEY